MRAYRSDGEHNEKNANQCPPTRRGTNSTGYGQKLDGYRKPLKKQKNPASTSQNHSVEQSLEAAFVDFGAERHGFLQKIARSTNKKAATAFADNNRSGERGTR